MRSIFILLFLFSSSAVGDAALESCKNNMAKLEAVECAAAAMDISKFLSNCRYLVERPSKWIALNDENKSIFIKSIKDSSETIGKCNFKNKKYLASEALLLMVASGLDFWFEKNRTRTPNSQLLLDSIDEIIADLDEAE